MRMFILLIVLFLSDVGLSQDNVKDLNHNYPQPFIDHLTGLLVYENPDTAAIYDGGDSKLLRDLAVLLSNNSTECDPFEFTRINLGFIVTADGKVVGARIKDKPIEKLNNFELHIIKSVECHLSGKWISGKVGDVDINQLMYYPIYVHLQ